ncbi:CmcJ/NvfI family oxidoreductase [Actibacterium lipolyticum]|uniref:Methyltransferase n=1 Tax=Actibacterium lipolyticum TaxID=1524263 RepID=A0A238JLU0_9RHOB|nr:CmcJ/NvfI family oxidoreductase [Actibacterium lipolyticum]SMX31383.1 hypothetical protein COL8621_00419 [Actibacterium lipolyticum]
MTRSGTLNYHVHKPFRQAFEIDAGGIVGNLISPELAATEVALKDQRDGNVSADFIEDGFAFAHVPTSVSDFEAEGWQQTYDAELTDLLQRKLGAKEVIVFDHTVRIDGSNADRRPARNVHSDYSPKGAEQRIVDILGAEKAADWSAGHYAFINVWRPVGAPINSAPLGFVRPSSVADADWIEIDLIYPDRKGQIMGLAANTQHEWVYRSRMTPDEVVFFNIYDNSGRPSVGHSAIDLTEDPNVTTIRKSIESRTLVRFQNA